MYIYIYIYIHIYIYIYIYIHQGYLKLRTNVCYTQVNDLGSLSIGWTIFGRLLTISHPFHQMLCMTAVNLYISQFAKESDARLLWFSCVFSDLIAKLANLSFSEGHFPSCFKDALVTLLLKKPGLAKDSPSNYRPISNLNHISKILERIFLSRILPHITSSPNFNPHQSAYRPNHSTESALLSP